jgi:Sigma-70, region 4
MDEDKAKEILRRISALEEHIINLIIPIQTITQVLRTPGQFIKLIELLKQGVAIDDRQLQIKLNDFQKEMRNFETYLGELSSLVKADHSHEIMYIGKRLSEIEAILKKIKEEGIKKNVELEFRCDGYELVKKPVSYDPQEPVQCDDKDQKSWLEKLDFKQSTALIHRYGLFGGKKKTYKAIGEIMGLSSEGVRRIIAKALRKCRHPYMRPFVEKIKNKDLRKEIFGDEGM